ncbi:MAG: SDR family NAD(P)-dependent oxidoreductase [Pseudomonadota bacterium]
MSAPLTVITGASGGIGQAIVGQLAAPGVRFALIGRNEERLNTAKGVAEKAGATALIGRLDVAADDIGGWLAMTSQNAPIERVFANAGLSVGPRSPAELESAADTQRLIDANLTGAISTVRGCLPAMRERGGQIVVVSSVAGLLPLPDLAVYAATKAALVAYAHAIRPRLARQNIGVTVVCPGFVDSPMSRRHHGAKPFLMSAEKGAAAIIKAGERNKRTAVFPLPFAALVAVERFAPGWLRDRGRSLFDAKIDRE